MLTLKRGCGLGNRVLLEWIKIEKERVNADKIKIEAQSYAKQFYKRAGFKQVSEEFLEDIIPHIQMILE